MTLVVAGSRALDLALRLKYAGIAQDDMMIVPGAPLRAMKRDVAQANRNKRQRKNRSARVAEVEGAEAAEALATASIQGYGIAEALDMAVRQTPAGETLYVVPTYTGLLEIQRELERRGLTPHYLGR